MTSARSSRRSSAAPRRTVPRVPTQWENLAIDFALTPTLNIVTADLTPEPIQSVTNDVGTAVLKRSILHFDLTAAVQDTDVQFVSFGIYVAGHEGFDQNAVSDPEGDFFQGWLYWTRRALNPVGLVTPMVSWDADIRSMRRLRGGYKLVAVASHPVQDIALVLRMSARFLWTVRA